MRKWSHILLRLLDGAPASDTQRERGQSLLEMAFITPLLAIMFVGIVEIGWYANHYLILLEVTRVGARSATGLSGELSPMIWNEAASIHPVVYEDGLLADPDDIPIEAYNYRNCNDATIFTGFYNYIACTMTNALQPLTLRGRAPNSRAVVNKVLFDSFGNVSRVIPFPDDMVISVFALQTVNNQDPNQVRLALQAWVQAEIARLQLAGTLTSAAAVTNNPNYAFGLSFFSRTYNFEANGATAGKYPLGPQVIAVGRYPRTANECNIWEAPDATRLTNMDGDPFDYIENGGNRDVLDGRFIELDGADTWPPEAQRGFVWTAQHRIRRTDVSDNELVCWGSEWDNEEVQTLFNLPSFVANEPVTYPWQAQRAYLPSQGVILVELFWMHELLLDFPFMRPIVTFFGDSDNITISVWAAFPVPPAEPNIVYDLTEVNVVLP